MNTPDATGAKAARDPANVRELKQTDGLLQLGCHHQLLALSQLQLCRKRHAVVQVFRCRSVG